MSSHTILTRSVRRILITGSILAMGLSGCIGTGALGAQNASAATAQTSVAPCTTTSDATPFARWGDDADYFLVPNGDFANGSADWGLSGGASVVNGGEPYGVVPGDSHSLALPAGAQAVSESMCLSMGDENVRLFVNNPGVPGAILHVQALVKNPLTGLTLGTAFDVNASSLPSGWGPSPILAIPNLLGGILDGVLTQDLTLTFTAQGAPATWNLDDVFVDPFKSA
jgi:hypothetical protein